MIKLKIILKKKQNWFFSFWVESVKFHPNGNGPQKQVKNVLNLFYLQKLSAKSKMLNLCGDDN